MELSTPFNQPRDQNAVDHNKVYDISILKSLHFKDH